MMHPLMKTTIYRNDWRNVGARDCAWTSRWRSLHRWSWRLALGFLRQLADRSPYSSNFAVSHSTLRCTQRDVIYGTAETNRLDWVNPSLRKYLLPRPRASIRRKPISMEQRSSHRLLCHMWRYARNLCIQSDNVYALSNQGTTYVPGRDVVQPHDSLALHSHRKRNHGNFNCHLLYSPLLSIHKGNFFQSHKLTK